MKIKLPNLECKRCGAKWHPRKTDVRQCPYCKSAYWDTERKPTVNKISRDGVV